ncbi:Crp/Fnr family transcriptional regulator [Vibrio mangrovi]|uniref:Crp/Fnr family transcriptional regulator n=1 Tax=Vibrio mangrovi TaxID=474394 RepID=A0A1Y6IXR9_9VIBR|nr:Crp/Fnr family transcriptional regulator [Vibrio mangrovi]MDW6004545.1 Crp/Fnr family transcriptional regulator [Vibrio mangrovi]SMS00833.1 Transcriptional activator protein Anr [Vibrio mangrovi]
MDRQHLKHQLAQFFEQYHPDINWSLFTLHFEIHALKKGDCLFRQGEHSDRMYFLSSGLVRYYSISESGKEYTQTFAKAPRVVGSTRAMVFEQPTLFTIEALDDSVAISFPWKPFYAQMSQDLAFMQAYARFLETIFIHKEVRESSMVKHSATQRYLDFCRDFPELKGTLPKQQIASYIGITPVALSRIRAQIIRCL